MEPSSQELEEAPMVVSVTTFLPNGGWDHEKHTTEAKPEVVAARLGNAEAKRGSPANTPTKTCMLFVYTLLFCLVFIFFEN